MGGIELFFVVQVIVIVCDKRLFIDIIILIDGEIWCLDEIFEYIWKQRDLIEGGIWFFVLGIGLVVFYVLVEGIVKVGGGYVEVV